jgi:hypothetical protein
LLAVKALVLFAPSSPCGARGGDQSLPCGAEVAQALSLAVDHPHLLLVVVVAGCWGEVVEPVDLLGGQFDAIGGNVLLDPGDAWCRGSGRRRRPWPRLVWSPTAAAERVRRFFLVIQAAAEVERG